jgi:DNA-binding LacI/PurR family transcriptional regulator
MSSQNSGRPTINDVARLAQVSISTVSRVLNHTAPVANETTEAVRRAIDLLGFQPHPGARRLAGGKTQTLGILLPDLTNPFFSPLLRGIERSVRASGFDLLVHYVNLSAFPDQQRP